MTNQIYLNISQVNFSTTYKIVGVMLFLSVVMTLLFQINTTGICHSKAGFILLYDLMFWGVAGYYLFQWVKKGIFSLGAIVFIGLGTLLINQVMISYGVEWSMYKFYGCGNFTPNWLYYLISNNLMTNLLCFVAFTVSANLLHKEATADLRHNHNLNGVKMPEDNTEKAISFPEEVALKDGAKHIQVKVAAIRYLEVEKNCITLHTENGLIILYQSLKSFSGHLNPDLFVRSHRSFLVNIHFVEKIINLPSGDGIVEMKTGEKLKVSRNYKPQLIAQFHAS